MSDSIFDLKQSLFTSNLPVPPPSRDRAPDKGPNFDQALNSAQRQNRDEHRASNSPEPARAENNKPESAEQPAAVPHDDQDQVTLSQHGTEDASPIAAEAGKTKKPAGNAVESAPDKQDTTAAEIAAAAIATQTQPVVKPILKSKEAEQHDGIELNDAVQPGGKHKRVIANNKEILATNTTNNPASANAEEVTTVTDEPAPVDPTEIVVAVATKFAPANKVNGTTSKPVTDRPNNVKAKQAVDEDPNQDESNGVDGVPDIRLTPEAENDPPAAKRRSETTQQTIPESNDNEVNLAAQIALNTVSSQSNNTVTTTAETAVNTAISPEILTISTNSAESPPPTNQPRGPQIPGSFANRLEAASAERKAADGANSVDRARFLQRVARAFQRAGENEGEIRLRLSPPELGAMKLEVTLRDGAMIARMETETTTARNLLMENLPQLKERLAEQNIRIETFEVEVRDQSNQSSADDAREQLRQQTEQQRNRLRGERATAPVVAAPIVRTLPAARQSSQLNVVI